MSAADTALIAVGDITKTYAMEGAPVHALRGVTLDVELRENFVRQVDTEVGWAVLDCFKGRAVLVDKNFLGEARRLFDGDRARDGAVDPHQQGRGARRDGDEGIAR